MNEKQHTKVYEFAEKADKLADIIEKTTDEVLSAVENLVGGFAQAIKDGAEEARIKADQQVVNQVNHEDSAGKEDDLWSNLTDKVTPKVTPLPKDVADELKNIIRDMFRGKGPL